MRISIFLFLTMLPVFSQAQVIRFDGSKPWVHVDYRNGMAFAYLSDAPEFTGNLPLAHLEPVKVLIERLKVPLLVNEIATDGMGRRVEGYFGLYRTGPVDLGEFWDLYRGFKDGNKSK